MLFLVSANMELIISISVEPVILSAYIVAIAQRNELFVFVGYIIVKSMNRECQVLATRYDFT